VYLPKHFDEQDATQLAKFIDENGFGILVTVVDGRPFASHIPFLYDRASSVLLGHVARANPQWQHFSDRSEVLVIFQGAHSYISPSWYLSAGVPTWNYVVAHVYGIAHALEKPQSVEKIIKALTAKYERTNNPPWTPKYDEKMLQAIVGIEVQVKHIEGKFKLSQNRSAADRAAVIKKLEESSDASDRAVAALMRTNEL